MTRAEVFTLCLLCPFLFDHASTTLEADRLNTMLVAAGAPGGGAGGGSRVVEEAEARVRPCVGSTAPTVGLVVLTPDPWETTAPITEY